MRRELIIGEVGNSDISAERQHRAGQKRPRLKLAKIKFGILHAGRSAVPFIRRSCLFGSFYSAMLRIVINRRVACRITCRVARRGQPS